MAGLIKNTLGKVIETAESIFNIGIVELNPTHVCKVLTMR